MSKFITVRQTNGVDCLINVAHIVAVQPYGNNYVDLITVAETFSTNLTVEQVKYLIEQAEAASVGL